jgi:hypothetical protein
MEREKGIEPSPLAWEASVLPLNYSRFLTSHKNNSRFAKGREVRRVAPHNSKGAQGLGASEGKRFSKGTKSSEALRRCNAAIGESPDWEELRRIAEPDSLRWFSFATFRFRCGMRSSPGSRPIRRRDGPSVLDQLPNGHAIAA